MERNGYLLYFVSIRCKNKDIVTCSNWFW